MTIISGTGDIRSDCKRFAKCNQFSLYYCRAYCQKRSKCILLTVGRPKTTTVAARRKYKNDWSKRHHVKVNNSRRRTRDKKVRWLEKLKKQKGCCICGYSKCTKAIDSHHIEKKTHNISTMFRQNCSLERIKKELKKCVFICKNCHYEVHSGLAQIPKNMERAQ